MREFTVTSVSEFSALLERETEYGAIFRGVADSGFELLPRVGRLLKDYVELGADVDALLRDERRAFSQFCEEAASLFPAGVVTAWDKLVIAQHHGLPTRLLDWTENPLVALWFACSARPSESGCVYVLSQTKQSLQPVSAEQVQSMSPFDLGSVYGYYPQHFSARVARQRGLFTVHGEPTTPFISPFLWRIAVPSQSKVPILKSLKWFGVTDSSLFPDLDGLARFVSQTAFLNFGPK